MKAGVVSRRVHALVGALVLGCGGGAATTGGASLPPKAGEKAPTPDTATSPSTTTTGESSGEGEGGVGLDEAKDAFDAASGDCARMCKALDSMKRAADHLCALASDDDDKKRCDDARARVASAVQKVSSTCGGCG